MAHSSKRPSSHCYGSWGWIMLGFYNSRVPSTRLEGLIAGLTFNVYLNKETPCCASMLRDTIIWYLQTSLIRFKTLQGSTCLSICCRTNQSLNHNKSKRWTQHYTSTCTVMQLHNILQWLRSCNVTCMRVLMTRWTRIMYKLITLAIAQLSVQVRWLRIHGLRVHAPSLFVIC